ncbi:DJ-1/PfpI family protein [Flagellimonas lutimaris]|uniref:DJ-1/PfpI family protein n=1 Tax=Flagellimonas lutimaris TaxID=475082 RepID=A0A3A1N550_9FLAO|nr:DJ-1/PfpI family protein [Allomuricauda lutimaris]RIV31661.1 DJ-1/PfpI family protein [Allomuricauda lutimaris]
MKIVIYIYHGLTMLDAIGPYEVLRNIPNAEVLFVAEKKGDIIADSKFVHLNARFEIEEINEADILVIPGSTITFMREIKNVSVMNWIRKINKTTKWTTSVCSGSIILAATGLLNGLEATSHWKPMGLLKKFGAIPKSERFVDQGKYLTAAGVSAGIDMALYLSNKIVGETKTKAIQLFIEYDPSPIYNSGNYSRAEKEVIENAEMILLEEAKKEPKLFQQIKRTTPKPKEYVQHGV